MRTIETIQRQLLGLIGRAVVKSISAATKCQTVDVSLIAGEPKAGVEHLEPYGFTARANSGAEAVVAGSDLYVFRPVAHKVDFHIRVTPDTPEIRAAITAELRSFLLRDGYPQGELKVSRISEAISGANGEYSHQLLAPADNISIAKNELAVLGTISWT